jgi:hypothetical protein
LKEFSQNGKLRNDVINYKQGFKYLKKEVQHKLLYVLWMMEDPQCTFSKFCFGFFVGAHWTYFKILKINNLGPIMFLKY